MDAEAPLFLMYTSGTTGKPKGCQHRTGGYLAYVTGTTRYYQDIHPEDVYWCMADIGWITGHSYIVYGPLSLAATSVLYEGVPNYPDAGRPWRIAEQLGVNIFHTSPTAIRMLRKAGPDEPAKYNYHFKHMTTVGEPIEPEAWRWYHEVVGKGEAVIVDTWWQTETGGFLDHDEARARSDEAGQRRARRRSAFIPVIYDEDGKELSRRARARRETSASATRGRRSCRRSGRTATASCSRYYAKYCKNPKSTDWRDWPYFAADGAVAGGRRLLPHPRSRGRRDQRRGTPAGHQGARVGMSHGPGGGRSGGRAGRRRDQGPHARRVRVAEAGRRWTASRCRRRSSRVIETMIGKIARPKSVHIVPDLPKTRSGKIMRRILAAISNTMDAGDVTTLANPEIVETDPEAGAGEGPVVMQEGPGGRQAVRRAGIRGLERARVSAANATTLSAPAAKKAYR